MSRILTETQRDRREEILKMAADQSRMNEKFLERMDALMTRQQQADARLAELHKAPPPQPPPPPDYVSLAHSALAVFQNIVGSYLASSPATQPALAAHSPPAGTASGLSYDLVDATLPTPMGTEAARPLAVTRVTPLSGSPVRPQKTPPSVPVPPPANPRTKAILREYLASVSEADALSLFTGKDSEQLTKWINHLNAALAQDPAHGLTDQNHAES